MMPDGPNIARFFNSPILRRVVLGFEIMLVVAILAIGFRLIYSQKTLIPLYDLKLEKKLNNRINAINAFLDEEKSKAQKLREEPQLLDAFSQALAGYDHRQSFLDYSAKIKEAFGFKSLSLIDNNSRVLLSTNENLQGINFSDEAYSNTPIFRSLHASLLTLTPDFSDFLYSTLLKEPAFYITLPVFKDNRVLGIMAFQIDDKKLNVITRDYLDLGKSGEIVLAVQTGPSAYFITPTRNNPSIRFTKKDLFSESGFSALQRAALGESSHGFDTDYLGQKVLATWAFIPRVDWAIAVKINLSEIHAPIEKLKSYLSVLSLLAGLFLLVLALLFRRELALLGHKLHERYLQKYQHKMRYLVWILLALFSYLSIQAIISFYHARDAGLIRSQETAKKELALGIEAIDAELDRIRLLSDFIVQDLQAERLISEDIKRRLRRDINETEGLVRITIAYAPKDHGRLYAPSIVQGEDGRIFEEMIENRYDYTDKSEAKSKTAWYQEPFDSKSPVWLNPSLDPQTKTMVITYARPFFFDKEQKTPSGVISINYKLSRFAAIAQNIGIGPTGYTFLLAKDGTFLYHPIEANVRDKKTLLQFAQEEGNDQLERIALEIKDRKPLLTEFTNPATTFSSWIYSQPITQNGWTMATVFSSKEIGLSLNEVKRYLFAVIIYLTLALLFLSVSFAHTYTQNKVFSFINFSNLILIGALCSLWFVIDKTEYSDNKDQILITDASSVNKFINRQSEEAQRKNEPMPIPVPVGIELYSLEQSDPTRVSFSGYIWHKYHKVLHADVKRTIRMPQAIAYRVISEVTSTEGDWETIGLNVSATLYHEHDYTTYPFDKHHIVIPLEHGDLTKNIILVPDLEGYKNIDPWKLPGLDTTFASSKFYTKETYFNLTPYKPNADFGVRQFLELSDQYRLAFNAITINDLLVPFIFFFLPLLVILISIFAVLVLEERETSPYTMIGPYTGLFFALVLLHRSLHEAAPADHTLYIEYAFFYSYIIIFLLVVHTILVQRFAQDDFYQAKLIPFFKIIFWPIQLLAWIITTIIVFY